MTAARYRRDVRWCVAAACALVAVSCSGGDDAVDGEDGSTVDVSAVPATPSTTSPSSVDALPATTDPEAPPTVTVEVQVGGLSAVLAGEVADSDDPFETFFACAGLRSAVNVYSVLASTVDGEVRSVSVASVEPVMGPGVSDALIRVERASGDAVDAVGTISLDDGLASGTYAGFDPAGQQVTGRFDCEGGFGVPLLLATGDDDGSRVLEVSALMRNRGAERLVGLAAAESTGASFDCPGTAPDSIVRVDGDATVGSVTAFEMVGGGSPMVRLRIGSTTYDLDGVTIGDIDRAEAGTFSGLAGGVTVDGAYRCS